MDFFTVSLCVTEIAAEFHELPSSVSWGITVTLMLRSVGALIFGTLADRYGRKWPMITCLVLFIILELSTGFTHNLHQFLGVRALYGIAMGGKPRAITSLPTRRILTQVLKVSSALLPRPPSKISPTMPEVSCLACSSKVTQRATFWPRFSTELSSRLPRTVGAAYSGLGLDRQYSSLPIVSVCQKPTTLWS